MTNLVDRLDVATSRAIELARKSGLPLRIDKKVTLVGNFFINKNSNDLYDILDFSKKVVAPDVSCHDTAVTVCQRLTVNEHITADKILKLDQRYSLYRTEMIIFLHCIKGARKNKEYDRIAVLEDKFANVELMARAIKNDIGLFKIPISSNKDKYRNKT